MMVCVFISFIKIFTVSSFSFTEADCDGHYA